MLYEVLRHAFTEVVRWTFYVLSGTCVDGRLANELLAVNG